MNKELVRKLYESAETAADNRLAAEFGPAGGNPEAQASDHLEYMAAKKIEELLSCPSKEELITLYAVEVLFHAGEIDPGPDLHWYSMAVGWAIAKGLSPSEAHAFALEHGG